MSVTTVEEVNEFFQSAFKGRSENYPEITVMETDRAVSYMKTSEANLRPGNYVSGPTQMALVDQIAYAVIFTRIGITPMAVTSNLNINFLRPCKGDGITAEAKLMKLGRTLAVIDVTITADGMDKPSSHAVVTYALPQN